MSRTPYLIITACVASALAGAFADGVERNHLTAITQAYTRNLPDLPVGPYALVADANLTSGGDVIAVLGDGGLICGPFTIATGQTGTFVSLPTPRDCIGGSAPNFFAPHVEGN